MDFQRAVDIFKDKKIYFANPIAWEDPYETRLKHPENHLIFASCWCQSGISDAMWRIYSPQGFGVRISVDKDQLKSSIISWIRKNKKGYKLRSQKIEYLPQRELNEEINKIKKDLQEDFEISRAVDALYLKREAFSHEDEWRTLLYCPGNNEEQKGIYIPINPKELIKNILIDPRSPDALADAYKHYFSKILGYSGLVQKSVLYKVPKPIVIDDII